jgi:type II secretory pathway pseudopilin PulG
MVEIILAMEGCFMKKQKGQSLIEVLLAFSVAIVILGAVITAVITSLSSNQYTKNQNLATSYAKEGIAEIRVARDSQWGVFSAIPDGDYCLPEDIGRWSAYDLQNCVSSGKIGDSFSRKVTIKQNSTDCASVQSSKKGTKATVTVFWSDKKCTDPDPAKSLCNSVVLDSCFSSNVVPTDVPHSCFRDDQCNRGNPCETPTCVSKGNPDSHCAWAPLSGEQGLPACQTCVSGVLNNTANQQDIEGTNTCGDVAHNTGCKKCVSGSCVNQASTEDLFNVCTASACNSVLNAASDSSCVPFCSSGASVKQNGLCKGDGISCQSSTCSTCVSSGNDAMTTTSAGMSGSWSCTTTTVNNCSTAMAKNTGYECSGITTNWTRCNCQ